MSARASRRAVLAFIALADAPMPTRIDLDAYSNDSAFSLHFDRIADARAWLTIFGAALSDPVERDFEAIADRPAWRSMTTYDQEDWRGWRVRVDGREDIDLTACDLDDAIAAQLREVANSQNDQQS